MDFETICLKNKLQNNLQKYLENSHNSYTILQEGIESLKRTYSNNTIIINQLNQLRSQLYNLRSSRHLNVEDLTWNWDKILMIDINKIVDTSGNHELERQNRNLERQNITLESQLRELQEQNINLQKQIVEIKEINLQQNLLLEQIYENTY